MTVPKANIKRLSGSKSVKAKAVTFGACTLCDPRIDASYRERVGNIVEMVASTVGKLVKMPGGSPVNVFWSPFLIDREKQADIVARLQH